VLSFVRVASSAGVGWHIWHNNSFNRIYRSEQDLSELTKYSDFLKIRPYRQQVCHAFFMRCILLFGLAAHCLSAADSYPPPRFTDPQRIQKLESAMPRVDAIMRGYATSKKIPGMVWGVVIDDRLAHVGTFGVRDRVSNAPMTADTAFRIASMTKSFTALAILKLRDEGKLSL